LNEVSKGHFKKVKAKRYLSMDIITLPNDINVFYVTAQSFPDGIQDAHEKLHSLLHHTGDRNYFGISRPEENGRIVYKAAVEEKNPGEAERLSCETLVIKKGKYVSTIIKDYMEDPHQIGKAFEKLIACPDIDPYGYCIEWYKSDTELVCMVRMATAPVHQRFA
jgi:predicted transcriptional regulator YdeE